MKMIFHDEDEYGDHMDELARRIGGAVDGEDLDDAVIAMAACIALGLIEMPPEKRERMRDLIDRFIDDVVQKGVVSKFSGAWPDG